MPLFEYHCHSCKKDFEVLELPGRETQRICSGCSSNDVTQRVSVFSAHGSASSTAGDGGGETCGRCGNAPGSCAPGG